VGHDVAMLPEEQILPVDEDDDDDDEDQDDLVVGPKLVPATPIMRYAMREVVQEYEDEQSVSEYASLSDVDEY
jgi:acetyl-CoA carboxylase carboxyltransferase component